jgi:hypothetical protein
VRYRSNSFNRTRELTAAVASARKASSTASSAVGVRFDPQDVPLDQIENRRGSLDQIQ